MRRKKTEDEAALTPEPQTRQRLTPADIQQAEFRLSMRGYNEREVDELLDRLTEDWGAVLEENKRLREGAPVSQAASDPAVADAKREADAILAKARQEASEITRNASQRSSAPVAAPQAADVAAVSSFLNKERDFLQSLGRLVQGHAESVKSMAQTAKAAEPKQQPKQQPKQESKQESTPMAAPPAAAPAAPAPAKPTVETTPKPAERKPAEPAPAAPQKSPETPGAPTQPVVRIDSEDVAEPAPQANAPAQRTAQATPAPSAKNPEPAKEPVRIPEGGDRAPAPSAAERGGDGSQNRDEELSLRELFWGDE